MPYRSFIKVVLDDAVKLGLRNGQGGCPNAVHFDPVQARLIPSDTVRFTLV
jgi:hypothetical protein